MRGVIATSVDGGRYPRDAKQNSTSRASLLGTHSLSARPSPCADFGGPVVVELSQVPVVQHHVRWLTFIQQFTCFNGTCTFISGERRISMGGSNGERDEETPRVHQTQRQSDAGPPPPTHASAPPTVPRPPARCTQQFFSPLGSLLGEGMAGGGALQKCDRIKRHLDTRRRYTPVCGWSAFACCCMLLVPMCCCRCVFGRGVDVSQGIRSRIL